MINIGNQLRGDELVALHISREDIYASVSTATKNSPLSVQQLQTA